MNYEIAKALASDTREWLRYRGYVTFLAERVRGQYFDAWWGMGA